MFTTRVLVTLGGVVGLSMATLAEPQPGTTPAKEPAKDTQPAQTPTPASPAVPAKDAQPATKINKDAAELLEKARTAGKNAKDITATTEVTMKGDGAEGGATTRKGKIVATFTTGMFPVGMWRIEPEAKKGEQARVFAFDGKTVRGIDPEKKEMTERPTQQGMGFPMGEEGMLLPMWFMEQRQDMMAMMKPTITEQVIEDASAKIGDEKVTVVRQVRTMQLPGGMEDGAKPQTLTETVRLSLGADNLPRKAERTIEVAGGEETHKQQIVQTFSDLKVNTNPTAESFTLKAPEGYTSRKIEADENSAPALTVKEGDAALDFKLKDEAGKEYTLADFKGKVVVLDFWATWCGPCKQVMPAIQKVHEAFKDKPVAVIGVNTWERGEGAGPKYMAKQNYTYLCLLKGDDLAKAYGISGIPTIIVIDKEGKIAHITVGAEPNAEETLTKLINEKLK
ncbi:MAG: redoxin family protein [Phycisphaerales bacterium]|nr:redoxin family protein [Phycisphaerales bacterium]